MRPRTLPLLALAVLPLAAIAAPPADQLVLCAGRSGSAEALMTLRQSGALREEVESDLAAADLDEATRALLPAVWLEPRHADPETAAARAREFGALVGALCRAGA